MPSITVAGGPPLEIGPLDAIIVIKHDDEIITLIPKQGIEEFAHPTSVAVMHCLFMLNNPDLRELVDQRMREAHEKRMQ